MMSSARKGSNLLGRFKWTTQLPDNVPPEIELSDYQRLPSPGSESPSELLSGEGRKAEPVADLDLFLTKLYSYYCEKGLSCIIIKWIVEILSLIFVECFIWFFLLVVDWHALRDVKCGVEALESGNKPCDIAKEAINHHPLVPFTFTKGIIVGSMVILAIYGLFNFLKFIVQLKEMLKIRHFYYNSLNVTDREIQTTPWPVILEKVVQLQHSQQLCVVKNLSAHDVVMRIMRKENYLIGMLNKGVLAFPISCWIPGAGPAINSRAGGRNNHLILTKSLEWTLNWCIFQSMFDSKFCVRREFIMNPSLLKKRLVIVGIGVFFISPCLVIFMLVYLFLRHAEQFYHHPSTASSRRWSNLSKWIFREFNEVDHLFKHRMNNSAVYAIDYLKQFPSPIVSILAKFVSFVCGGFAAVLIIIAFLDESLLEGHIFGRNLFWYAAIFGAVTAISRAAVTDELQVLDPQGAMSLVVQHTHYMPKKWRGKENSDSVRTKFETLFQYTAIMLLEEMVSIFLTPILLIFIVPKRVDDILRFISDFTVYVEGVGDVCSLSMFDFGSHGNKKYGSPYDAARYWRSSQGKLEKSFLSFQSAYPTWEPSAHGQQFLSTLRSFREKHLHRVTHWDYSITRAQNFTSGLGGQDQIIHRFRSQNVLLDDGGVPRTDDHLHPPWLVNLGQRTPPYLLDWYYLSNPLHTGDNSIGSHSSSHELVVEPTKDMLPTHDGPQKKIVDEDEKWKLRHSDRWHSQLEASTSCPFFRNSDPGRNPEHHTMTNWWVRTVPRSPTIEGSFPEPPGFGHHNFNHHGDDVYHYAMEEQEDGGDGGCTGWNNLHNLSKTTYLDGSDTEEELSLPFVDENDWPVKKLADENNDPENGLKIRIIPRSSDPIR